LNCDTDAIPLSLTWRHLATPGSSNEILARLV
jgi:hypothetical protein